VSNIRGINRLSGDFCLEKPHLLLFAIIKSIGSGVPMLNALFKKTQFFFLCLFLFPLIACSAQDAPEKYQAGEGKDYEILVTPVRTNNPDKIEVAEAFWYGCPHCYDFEFALEPWVDKLPKDVYFVGVPVVWDDKIRTLHAKMFYTAQQLNKLNDFHSIIYAAMNINKKKFTDEAEIAAFFGEHGVDAKTFSKTFNSFSVDSLVKQSEAKVRGYNVTGTPTVIINGKYKIMGSPEKILEVANFLIEKERKAKKAAKK
jgi:thiol:disulfide interchange protein DsbA